ncbi:2-methylcitrate dehydratase [Mycolicibacterium agri]|uniref:2-methylcitrate dehydratase n=1 Tax=Mycolicibacterium agri TaxID=36811 RepID=A0A2A7NA22_MYCAG|nr:MmgE/PrpD family protein [Mycolicibacterium agri]PEG40633.1 2-methylcitrate dehydratase [Mycolicibacterium agri]GFG50375.1 MmgE/PrpD family protein [Mycolicibacterium agri]
MIRKPASPDAMSVGVTARLAAWTAELQSSAVPDDVYAHTARLVLDGLGVGLFGSTTQWGAVVADLLAEQGGVAEAAIWGTGVQVPATQAPLANGTFMHSFEFDDLHAAAVIHGAAQVVPAALAVAGHCAAASDRAGAGIPTAEEFALACVAGFEVGARVGLVTGSAQLSRGFHPSPNTGLFSAAATAGRLLNLDERQLRDAFGIAASSGGFLMAAQYGAMVKRMHPGRSAQAGVLAAMLAARGFSGIDDVLEQPYGGFASAYAGVSGDALGEIVDDLGERWETLRFSVKAYPCCGSNHTSVDALRKILDYAPNLKPDDIESIHVAASTLTAEHVGWPYVPDSVTSAQMNLAYTLAVLAVDRELFVEQFRADRIDDPRVLDLAARVAVQPDADIDREGREGRHHIRLTVTTRDGERYVEEVRHALGSSHRPLSGDAAADKYRKLAASVLAPNQVADLEAAVLALSAPRAETEPVARLLELVSAAPAATR